MTGTFQSTPHQFLLNTILHSNLQDEFIHSPLTCPVSEVYISFALSPQTIVCKHSCDDNIVTLWASLHHFTVILLCPLSFSNSTIIIDLLTLIKDIIRT